MNKIRPIKASAIALFLIVVFVAVKYPLRKDNGVLDLTLLVTPVLFSIFVAFSISERLSRVDRIRENDSNERSSLILIDTISSLLPIDKHHHIKKLIDEYLMATMDYKMSDYQLTYINYRKLAEYLLKLQNIESERDREFHQLVEKMLSAREQTVSLISDKLSKFEWLVYTVLAIGVVLPFLIVNSGTFLSVLLISILSASVLVILFFLYKLDSINWKRSIRIIEPYQKTFEVMGLKRYFPEALLSDKYIRRLTGNDYRVGHFANPYPDLSDKKIEYVQK